MSEASYVYILSEQKFIKNAKNGRFWWFFDNATFFVIFNHCDDHQKRPLKGASLPEKVLTFQGGETCCQNESADNTSIGSKVRNPLENTTKRI